MNKGKSNTRRFEDRKDWRNDFEMLRRIEVCVLLCVFCFALVNYIHFNSFQSFSHNFPLLLLVPL